MNWRVLAETDAADTTQWEYVYGNYLVQFILNGDTGIQNHDKKFLSGNCYCPPGVFLLGLACVSFKLPVQLFF